MSEFWPTLRAAGSCTPKRRQHANASTAKLLLLLAACLAHSRPRRAHGQGRSTRIDLSSCNYCGPVPLILFMDSPMSLDDGGLYGEGLLTQCHIPTVCSHHADCMETACKLRAHGTHGGAGAQSGD